MIVTKKGDLLGVKTGFIVHGCNAQGVMGSGVAYQIRNKYPEAYNVYKQHHRILTEQGQRSIPLGTNIYYNDGDIVIVNAITQEYYGRDPNVLYASYDAIEKCFVSLNNYLEDRGLSTVVNFPLIGCGLANGDWSIVSEIVDKSISDKHEKVLWTQ